MNASPTPQGPGSVSGAPNLPAGFTGTFTSRYVDTGDLRLHAVTGGDGPPLLLVHGWPQTWYAWRMLMPALARDFSVVAVDQRGIGLSDKPQDGYDTGTLASDLVKLMDALGHQRFALYGTDVGMPIAYALAADHPDRVDRLIVSEAPLPVSLPHRRCSCPRCSTPGSGTWPSTSSPRSTNSSSPGGKTSSSARGSTPGRDAQAARRGGQVLRRHARRQPRRPARQLRVLPRHPATSAQNEQRKTRRLTLPVLAIGGEESVADGAGKTMKLVADDVQSVVLAGSGHWVAEQAPEQLLAALTAFLAPYRDAAAHALSAPTAGA